MLYISDDLQYQFIVNDKSVSQILKYIKKSDKNETGGILIGNYSSDHSTAILKNITGPPSDSRHGPTWFQRGLAGLQNLLKKRWVKREYYLGEWHYHPFAAPNPSFRDIAQMNEISSSKTYHCPEPILLIIGGNWRSYTIRIFLTTKRSKFRELHFQKDNT